MKAWLCLLLLASPLVFAAPGDDYVLAARDAYRYGERVKLGKQLDALRTLRSQNELEPWVEYWQLRQRLEDDVNGDSLSSAAAVGDFLARSPGSYLAEKLRAEWLRLLGKRAQWPDFQRDYPLLVEPDDELVCYALQARASEQQDPSVLEEARPLWFSSLELANSCVPLMERLIVVGRITTDDVWLRLRHLLEANKLAAAKKTAGYLPQNQMPSAKTLDAIADKPLRYLDKSLPDYGSRASREMVLYAVERLAKSDPVAAADAWQRMQARFSATERSYAWAQIAWSGAQHHVPQALTWYLAADEAPQVLSEDQLTWRVRAALRASDWPAVQHAIENMPTQLAAKPDWTYWLGRALAAQGHPEEARISYFRISGQANFYGNLASEELGQPIQIPPRAAAPTSEELADVRANPGFRRALALFRLELRNEGVREWNWSLRGMGDRQLIAAAELARYSEVLDRSISSADRTQVEHDFSLRYPAPFRKLVDVQAKELSLDHGWIYGLMRQESRFVMTAQSGVGAQGLMQLMPKTAQWVARKIGLKGYRPANVAEMETNVALGTNYLRMVLASLDNHPLLASAAYNAGPSRARKWRADVPLEGAIYAETIPFKETREYVKKVMSNAVYYSALFEDQPRSLKSRLGVVGPRGSGPTDDLP